jgi:hypothetical protein
MTALELLITAFKRAILSETFDFQIRNQPIRHQILLFANDDSIAGKAGGRMYTILAESMPTFMKSNGIFVNLTADHADQVLDQTVVFIGELILNKYHQSNPF